MSTSLPTSSSCFTPEQSEILGRVYTFILSWRTEPEKVEVHEQTNPTASGEAAETFPTPGREDDLHE